MFSTLHVIFFCFSIYGVNQYVASEILPRMIITQLLMTSTNTNLTIDTKCNNYANLFIHKDQNKSWKRLKNSSSGIIPVSEAATARQQQMERAVVPRVAYYVSLIKRPVIRVHTVHASSISVTCVIASLSYTYSQRSFFLPFDPPRN